MKRADDQSGNTHLQLLHPRGTPEGLEQGCPSSVLGEHVQHVLVLSLLQHTWLYDDVITKFVKQLNNKRTKPGTTPALVDCVWTLLVECWHQGGRTLMEQLLKRTPDLWHGCSRLWVCPQRQCNWIGNLFPLHIDTLYAKGEDFLGLSATSCTLKRAWLDTTWIQRVIGMNLLVRTPEDQA